MTQAEIARLWGAGLGQGTTFVYRNLLQLDSERSGIDYALIEHEKARIADAIGIGRQSVMRDVQRMAQR